MRFRRSYFGVSFHMFRMATHCGFGRMRVAVPTNCALTVLTRQSFVKTQARPHAWR